uniref:FERM, ARHGEF and pleckstrin domain-containing protein 1 n=1 Tax=Oncorhynchus kisutch TaxID=8019 RepID=A0A8C7N9T8_ONCKI
MVEPGDREVAGQRLGIPESLGVSTLEPGQRPPTTPPGRQVSIRVQLLDDVTEVFDISQRAPAKALFDLVCVHLNLAERDYFGLQYQNPRRMMVWLDLLKPTLKQIRRPKNTILRFVVKFFPPDHTQLLEELTRYLFALQIKHDLACGRLTCNATSAALLVSHIVQSEIGDFDEVQSFQHLLHNKYMPNQDALMDKITEYHHKHVGQTPAESDYQLHPAKDREGTKLSLAVSHIGLLVFQGHTKINAFNWSKVRKLSFKRKRFLIKLRPDLNSAYQDTLEFVMASRDCCKTFWKICVEYHAFFRLFEEPKPKAKAVLFTRGSSFRFSGRTQKQVFDYVKDSEFQKVPFESVSVDQTDSPLRLIIQVPVDDPTVTNGHQAGPGGPEAQALASTTGHPEQQISGPVRQAVEGMVVNGQKAFPFGPGQSSNGHQPSPINAHSCPLSSPLFTDAGYVRTDDEDEKCPTDKAYFIAKELLTTERTFLKDLAVITVAVLGKEDILPDSVRTLINTNYDPVYQLHQAFLKEVEQRLQQWEGRSNAHIKGDYQRVGDVMLKNIQGLKQLTSLLQRHGEVLVELERSCRASQRLQELCREFEQQKVCYLSLNMFLLRPLHRLLHYKLILERLCKHYPPTHQDFRDSRAALADISEMVLQLQGTMMKMENIQKLLELKKDLTGIQDLAIPGREFIRLGCLSKLSGKGLQQRMFFLFSDSLVYTSRGMTADNQFKVHGQLPLYGMTIRESEDEWGVPHSFTLFGQHQSVVVAASCVSEMVKWMEDIRMAVVLVEQSNRPSTDLLSTSRSDRKSPEEGGVEAESEEELSASRSSLERQSAQRGNTTVHVCWHRNTSVSMVDFSVAVENQLSGNLLRKFKNSNGWQKLWVVFTNFSLFFYKSHQDDYPLASLPLLGYSLTVPAETENIQKDYVFKLHFKSHVYYFRSESQYTFQRSVPLATCCCGSVVLSSVVWCCLVFSSVVLSCCLQ